MGSSALPCRSNPEGVRAGTPRPAGKRQGVPPGLYPGRAGMGGESYSAREKWWRDALGRSQEAPHDLLWKSQFGNCRMKFMMSKNRIGTVPLGYPKTSPRTAKKD